VGHRMKNGITEIYKAVNFAKERNYIEIDIGEHNYTYQLLFYDNVGSSESYGIIKEKFMKEVSNIKSARWTNIGRHTHQNSYDFLVEDVRVTYIESLEGKPYRIIIEN
jgi:hypothetical protein